MAGRGVLYVMPSMAVLAAAVLVLGPGRERPAVGARVWGVPAAGTRVLAWRLDTMERQFGSDRAVSVDAMELSLLQGGKRLGVWSGGAGKDGVAEAVVETAEPLAGALEVRITQGQTPLAHGTIALRPAEAVVFERRAAEGTAAGPIALRVEIAQGVLGAPFAGLLRVIARRGGAPAEGVTIRPSASGAEVLATGMELATNAAGEVMLRVVPTWHSVELKLEAVDRRADPPTTSTWEGGVPVQPGALWLGPGRPKAEVLSPVPRDRAYVSGLLPGGGRVFGAVVPLAKNASGLYEGALDVTELTRLGAEVATVASDPQEAGTGTVTWPLEPIGTAVRAPRVELLLDGVPFAERREQARARTARLASVAVALVAGLFEVVLLVLHSRDSQQKLAAHMAQLGEGEGDKAAAARMMATPASRALTLVALVGLVVLGFGVVAAFAIVH